MTTKIIVLGASGMAGRMIFDYLTENTSYDVVGTYRQKDKPLYLDASDSHSIHHFISFIGVYKPHVIINCIGMLVKESDENPELATRINWAFPHLMAKACDTVNAKLIHISTDCVFNGNNGPYNEWSEADEIGNYGRTKALGEGKSGNHLTLRTSIVGPDADDNGSGLMNWIMKQRGIVHGYSNVMWNGITTLELAKQIDSIITRIDKLSGLYHLTTDVTISKFDLLGLFEKHFHLPILLHSIDVPVINKCLINNRKAEYDPHIPLLDKQIHSLACYCSTPFQMTKDSWSDKYCWES